MMTATILFIKQDHSSTIDHAECRTTMRRRRDSCSLSNCDVRHQQQKQTPREQQILSCRKASRHTDISNRMMLSIVVVIASLFMVCCSDYKMLQTVTAYISLNQHRYHSRLPLSTRRSSFVARQYSKPNSFVILEKQDDIIQAVPKNNGIDDNDLKSRVSMQKAYDNWALLEKTELLGTTTVLSSSTKTNTPIDAPVNGFNGVDHHNDDDITSDGSIIVLNSIDSKSINNDNNNNNDDSNNQNFILSKFFGNNEVYFARFILLVAAALYGTNFSIVKILGELDIPIGLSATLRFGLAALATSPWLLASTFMKPSASKSSQNNNNNNGVIDVSDMTTAPTVGAMNGDVTNVLPDSNAIIDSITSNFNMNNMMISIEEMGAMKAGFIAGMWNCVGYIAQAFGLTTTLASKSAFLCSLAVVIVPLLDRFTGKKLEMKQIIGIIVCVAGVAFLELGGVSSTDLMTITPGDIASLLQPIAFGVAFWKMEHACTEYPKQATRLTASQLLAVFVGSLLFTIVSEPQSLSSINTVISYMSNPMILGSLLWTGLITTACTIYMETIALKSISASETTLILSTEPLWGSVFAAILMGETFGIDSGIGGIFIIIGCIYSSLGYNGIQQLFNMNNNQNNNNDNESKQHDLL